MTVGPRSHYVRCVGWPRCRFTSHRRADTPREALRKPCPRREAPVVVIQRPHAGRREHAVGGRRAGAEPRAARERWGHPRPHVV